MMFQLVEMLSAKGTHFGASHLIVTLQRNFSAQFVNLPWIPNSSITQSIEASGGLKCETCCKTGQRESIHKLVAMRFVDSHFDSATVSFLVKGSVLLTGYWMFGLGVDFDSV
jgi:hypothetical protein